MACLRLLNASCVACLLLGCGSAGNLPQLVPVKGTITVDGSPGADLVIIFQPVDRDDASLAIAETDSQGDYTLRYGGQHQGAPLGKHRVTIQRANEAEVPVEELLPARFNEESELTAEVTSGKERYDFDLQTGR